MEVMCILLHGCSLPLVFHLSVISTRTWLCAFGLTGEKDREFKVDRKRKELLSVLDTVQMSL